jgi:alpha-tubulin suppressor-like RCC1 family protein
MGQNAVRLHPALVTAGLGNVHVVTVACGEQHSAVLAADGSVFTFGIGKAGQLGHGDFRAQSRPKLVAALHGENV